VVAAEQATDSDWYLWIPEGVIYGPITLIQLDQWVREGRVALGCQLRREDSNHWEPAELRYPDLSEAAASSGAMAQRPSANTRPVANAAGAAVRPDIGVEPNPRPAHDRVTLLPHRSAYILTLALVGLFVPCPVFSVLAWHQGTQDLYDMHTGVMDSSGRSQTQFGRKLGMVVVLFWSMIFLTAAIVGAIYWAIR
jgi:hypothetical protein